MSMRLRTLSETPPSGMHRYLVPETNQWIPSSERFYAYSDLRDAVARHYTANKLPVPLDLDSRIQAQECASLPGSWCVDSLTGIAGNDGNSADCNSIMVLIQGTRTLADWKVTSGEIVPDDEIVRRSSICTICQFNDTIPGCTSCNSGALKAIVDSIVGTSTLPSDATLKSCKICCCGLAAKVRLPLDVLQRNLSDRQKAALPSFCWLK